LGATSLATSVEIRKRQLDVAAGTLEVAPNDLILWNGWVEIVGIKGSGAMIAQVAERARRVTGPIAGSGRCHLLFAMNLVTFVGSRIGSIVRPGGQTRTVSEL